MSSIIPWVKSQAEVASLLSCDQSQLSQKESWNLEILVAAINRYEDSWARKERSATLNALISSDMDHFFLVKVVLAIKAGENPALI